LFGTLVSPNPNCLTFLPTYLTSAHQGLWLWCYSFCLPISLQLRVKKKLETTVNRELQHADCRESQPVKTFIEQN